MRLAVIFGFLGAAQVAGQCGPGGEKAYPPGSTECPSTGDGMAAHIDDEAAPAPAPLPAGQQASGDSNVCAVGPCPASLLGNVGYTTATGTDARSGITFSPGQNVFGPFEAGFSSMQDNILSAFGCNPSSNGYLAGGIDTQTASDLLTHSCGVAVPRVEGNRYIGLIDECGGHTNDYHFHQRMACLYEQAGGHSAKVATALDNQDIFGMWEDFAAQKKPLLDACGGHFGITPTSNGKVVYHYHVQEKPPFFVGCFGPGKDATTGQQKLVTMAECRAAYPTDCGDGDAKTITTSTGTFTYDYWCPCFDEAGSNHEPAERAVFTTAGESLTCADCTSAFTPVTVETSRTGSTSGTSSLVSVVLWVVGIAAALAVIGALFACFCGGGTKRGMYTDGSDEYGDEEVPYDEDYEKSEEY